MAYILVLEQDYVLKGTEFAYDDSDEEDEEERRDGELQAPGSAARLESEGNQAAAGAGGGMNLIVERGVLQQPNHLDFSFSSGLYDESEQNGKVYYSYVGPNPSQSRDNGKSPKNAKSNAAERAPEELLESRKVSDAEEEKFASHQSQSQSSICQNTHKNQEIAAARLDKIYAVQQSCGSSTQKINSLEERINA